MKNIYTFVFGLLGLLVMTGVVITGGFVHKVSPNFLMWVGVVGLLLAGELVLIGIGKNRS